MWNLSLQGFKFRPLLFLKALQLLLVILLAIQLLSLKLAQKLISKNQKGPTGLLGPGAGALTPLFTALGRAYVFSERLFHKTSLGHSGDKT